MINFTLWNQNKMTNQPTKKKKKNLGFDRYLVPKGCLELEPYHPHLQ